MSTTIAQSSWLPYLRPSFGARPTAKEFRFHPPRGATSEESSSVAKEPKLFSLHDQLDRISLLSDNWDGHGSVRPNPFSVANARAFLEEAYRQSIMTASWQTPHISASEDGEIAFEWWNGNRKLTVYLGQQPTYIKSWGPHVVNEMEDGVVPEDGISSLWAWLFA